MTDPLAPRRSGGGRVPLAGDALASLAGELKRLCGSGGTVRDGVIEVL